MTVPTGAFDWRPYLTGNPLHDALGIVRSLRSDLDFWERQLGRLDRFKARYRPAMRREAETAIAAIRAALPAPGAALERVQTGGMAGTA